MGTCGCRRPQDRRSNGACRLARCNMLGCADYTVCEPRMAAVIRVYIAIAAVSAIGPSILWNHPVAPVARCGCATHCPRHDGPSRLVMHVTRWACRGHQGFGVTSTVSAGTTSAWVGDNTDWLMLVFIHCCRNASVPARCAAGADASEPCPYASGGSCATKQTLPLLLLW